MNTNDFHTNYADELAGLAPLPGAPCSGHQHSGYETYTSGAANACPICQASEIRRLRVALEAVVTGRLSEDRDDLTALFRLREVARDALAPNNQHSGGANQS